MDADLLPVLVHIQAGLDGDLSLAALSRESGLSESTLKRRIRDATGESPRQHVERLRLERAASQLLYLDTSILEVALDNGFGSHEVFARAFGRHFDMPPSAWRRRGSAGDLGIHDRQPGLTEGTYGVSLSSTRIVEMRSVEVAFLRHTGPYQEVPPDSWSRIRDRLRELGLPTDGLPAGIAHDDPRITPPENLRFDAAWTIASDLPPECGLGQQTLPGGSYAVTTYVGPLALLGHAYGTISERLMRHADAFDFGLDDFHGTVEWYRTGAIDDEHYLNQIDITFPVKARARGPWSWSEPRVLDPHPAPPPQETDMPAFDLRTVPEQPIAALRVRGPIAEIGTTMAAEFPRIFETVTKAGIAPAGPPMARYYDPDGAVVEYELAIPLTAPFVGDGDIQPGTIGGGEVAHTVHVGPYDQLGRTWEALATWIGSQGKSIAAPGWEWYVDDPQETDPATLRTEVFWPVR
jgi:AraC family transcriptional regulator